MESIEFLADLVHKFRKRLIVAKNEQSSLFDQAVPIRCKYFVR